MAAPDTPDEASTQGHDLVVFRLYVSLATPVSSRAIVNTRRFCEEHLAGRHELHILDIAEHLEAANADEVIASPTLVRVAPLPKRRFIGDMSDTRYILSSLGMSVQRAKGGPA